MAQGFLDGEEDLDGLLAVDHIVVAAARLRAAALDGLRSYYSDAQIADALGVSRQAVSQGRRRRNRGAGR